MRLEVIIPAYRPDSRLNDIIARLKTQRLCPDRIRVILTTDSSSEAARLRSSLPGDVVLETVHVSAFSHGTTRLKAALTSKAELIMFMTQDALPVGDNLTEALMESLGDGRTAVAYARQLPYAGASDTEVFARNYNYPPESRIKTRDDLEKEGIRAAFCSDTCAMYSAEIFRRLGGFERDLDFNEDLFFAYKALCAGYNVAYCAAARVYHSHDLTLRKLFRRYFDNAASQKRHPEIFSKYPSEAAGRSFVRAGLSFFLREKQYRNAARFFIESSVKYLGFLSGRLFGRRSGR